MSKEHLIPWVKGQSGNPGGKPKDPPEFRTVMLLTKTEMMEVGSLLLKGDIDSIREMYKDPKTPALKLAICSVILQIIKKGDMHTLDLLLNRLIGKPKEEIDFNVNMPRVMINLPQNGRETLKHVEQAPIEVQAESKEEPSGEPQAQSD